MPAYVTTIIDGAQTNLRVDISHVDGLPKIVTNVFHTCFINDKGAHRGIDEGTHALAFHARIPGASVVLTTPAYEFKVSCSPTNDDIARESKSFSPASGPAPGLTSEIADDEKHDVGCQGAGAMPIAALALIRGIRRYLEQE